MDTVLLLLLFLPRLAYITFVPLILIGFFESLSFILVMQRDAIAKSGIFRKQQERLNQKKELESVASQRNILATQLIKRNEELGYKFE